MICVEQVVVVVVTLIVVVALIVSSGSVLLLVFDLTVVVGQSICRTVPQFHLRSNLV